MNFQEFENEIADSYIPKFPRRGFVLNLQQKLRESDTKRAKGFQVGLFRSLSAIALIVSIVVVLLIGPQRVLAQIQAWLGFAPGLGLVSSEAEIRVLKEPVHQTRDGITVEIRSVIANAEKTVVSYRIDGVPSDAYNNDESKPFECLSRPWILTDRGASVEATNDRNTFAALPEGTESASLILPCLPETKAGKVPENWHIPFSLMVSSLQDLAMPVMPDPLIEPAENSPTAEKQNIDPMPGTALDEASLQIEKTFQTANGYIFIGTVPVDYAEPGQISAFSASLPIIYDGNQNRVHAFQPANRRDLMEMLRTQIEEGKQPWMVETDSANLVFPLRISLEAQSFTKYDEDLRMSFTFDSAKIPDAGSILEINEKFQIGDSEILVQSVKRTEQGIYEFELSVPSNLAGLDISIPGAEANWFASDNENGSLKLTPYYEIPPEGNLDVVLSNPVRYGKRTLFSAIWSPPAASHEAISGVAENPACQLLDPFQPFDESTANLDGKLLFAEPNAESGDLGLVLYDFDRTNRRVITDRGFWGEFSSDGQLIAYSDVNRELHIYNLQTQEDLLLPNAFGYDIKWSPDGNQLAYVNTDPQTGVSINVIQANGAGIKVIDQHQQINPIGFSANGETLYYSKRYLPENTDQTMHAVDLKTGAITDFGVMPEYNAIFFDETGAGLIMVSGRTGNAYRYDLEEKAYRLLAQVNDFSGGFGRLGVVWGASQLGRLDKQDQYAIVDYNQCKGWLMDYSVVGGSLVDIFITP